MHCTKIYVAFVLLYSALYSTNSMLLNCPVTNDELIAADEVKDYFHLVCDGKCESQKNQWLPGELMDSSYLRLFQTYNKCFKTCGKSITYTFQQLRANTTRLRRRASLKAQEVSSCKAACVKRINSKKAITNETADNQTMEERRHEECSQLCNRVVENMAKGDGWLMYQKTRIPQNIDNKTLSQFHAKREELEQHARYFGEVYCSRDALSMTAQKKKGKAYDVGIAQERCRNATRKLWEREAYFCLLFVKQ